MTEPLVHYLSRVPHEASRIEVRLHELARQTVGLRLLDRIGWTRMIRAAVVVFWLVNLWIVPTQLRTDLLRPGDLGSDTSNYVAAGERLAAGHPLYALVPGDRPVPLDNPPDWSVPLLSPPPIAATSLWVVTLPDGFRLYPTWAFGLAATVALGLLVAALAPPLLLLVAIQLIPGMAITAWSGNVNAVIAPALVAAWFGMRSSRPRVQAATGVVIAIATGVKIGPILVAAWLVAQSRRTATIALIVTGVVLFAFTTLVAGWDSWFTYLDIARHAAEVPAQLSLPSLLRGAGLEGTLVRNAIPVMILGVTAFVFLFPDRRVAFSLAVIGTVFATTVVRYETLSVGIAAMAPWLGRGLVVPALPSRPWILPRPSIAPGRSLASGDPPRTIAITPRLAAIGACIVGAGVVAGLAVAVSFATGGLTHSTIRIANERTQPVVARFRSSGQLASWGYLVPAGAEITGWPLLGGQSPRSVTLWSTGCRLISEVRLPLEGGMVRLEPDAISVEPVEGPDPPAADFVPDCVGPMRSRAAGR
jgi:hypothetical protein